MNIKEIATQLKNNKENIILVYAFNATGKTRLCVEYKNITKEDNDGEHAGVYYNAYSEDLFTWDNDEEHDNADIKLLVKNSSLDKLQSYLITNPDLIKEKLKLYHPKYDFRLNPDRDPEKGIASITFFREPERGEKSIKISRGEERIFIWCFFLALFEVDGWADEQDAHFFIDDPVSSLDDHNIFVTAGTIYDLIKKNYLTKRIIVTTHHIGLYSILRDRLKRGYNSGPFRNLTKLFTLNIKDSQLVLKDQDNDVFLYHLYVLQILEAAKNDKLYRYHFVLLRQVLETISSFFGKKYISDVLEQIRVDDVGQATNLIHAQSHKDAYSFHYYEMNEAEENVFTDIFDKIQGTYNFELHS